MFCQVKICKNCKFFHIFILINGFLEVFFMLFINNFFYQVLLQPERQK